MCERENRSGSYNPKVNQYFDPHSYNGTYSAGNVNFTSMSNRIWVEIWPDPAKPEYVLLNYSGNESK